MTPENLAPRQIALLKDIAHLGMRRAGDALCRMLRQPVDIRVPSLRISPLTDAPEFLQHGQVLAVHLGLQGDAKGDILFLLPEETARYVLEKLLGRGAFTRFDDPMAGSTLLEIGNILASAFLAALDDRLRMSLLPSPPRLIILPPSELLERFAEPEGTDGGRVLLLETTFSLDGDNRSLPGHFCLRPSSGTLPELLKAAQSAANGG